MLTRSSLSALFLLFLLSLSGCGIGGSSVVAPPPPVTSIVVSGPAGVLNTGASRAFTATVTNNTNSTVIWSVVEPGGGAITSGGVYTAPALPGTYTVRATSQADPSASGTASVPVVIPVGHVPGYDVGVDYHAYGADFLHTAFLKIYDQASVRQTVRAQLQGMADRGATILFTRIWFVTEPGQTDFGESWRATFPLTDLEQANLRAYAQDVAAVQGSGGNRLRLNLCFLYLGTANYLQGSPSTGLGYVPITAADFAARLQLSTDKVLAAISGVTRPDGVPVVDSLYLDGEIMIGAKANQDWFLTTHYPWFVNRVTAAGFRPTVYFIVADTQADLLDNNYIDANYPILNNHRSMFWMYRSLRFMADQGLPIPARLDFSWYIADPAGAPFAQILARTLDDADATLPSLGAPQLYGLAETHYFLDDTQRRQLGLAISGQAALNPRLQRVCFWTTPDGGGAGVNIAYPFAIEDYYPPAP